MLKKNLFPIPGQKKTLSIGILESLPLFIPNTEHTPLIILTENIQQAQRLQAAWQFLRPNIRTAFFPDWEILAYERLSPHHDLVSERLATLWKINTHQIDIVFIPVSHAMQKLAPISFVIGRTFYIKTNDKINAEQLRINLINSGYQFVTHVMGAGEFSIRGGLIDLFPMGSEAPFRLDLFDDEIESIKIFDVDTQRTIKTVDEIRLLPAHEFPTDESAQKIFRQQFRDIIESNPADSIIYKAVSQASFGSGVEFYLPLFFEESCATIFDYIGSQAQIICVGDTFAETQRFEADIKKRFTYAGGDATYPPLPPQYLYLQANEFHSALKNYPRIILTLDESSLQKLPNLAIDRKQEKPLQAFENFTQHFSGKVLLCAESLGRRETMLLFLQQQNLAVNLVEDWQGFIEAQTPLNLTVAQDLMTGFQLNDEQIAVVTESELYQYIARSRHKRHKHKTISDSTLRDLAEIKIGDPVVHENHGIGRYMGLVNMNLGDGDNEMMLLEYANDAQLYVPVAQLHLISRYAGQAYDHIHLHQLGHQSWNKAKKKAAEKARDTAAELLNLYAQREAKSGFAFTLNEMDYHAFADGFAFEETEDQATAIVDVIKDLLQAKPMDRLVCGDVGFGKTEVALRAAFIAAMNGKQVAILAPTTLLVEQHFQVFNDRFANFPIKVAQLSRFNSNKETKQNLAGLAEGTVDIVIGTHKLIQPSIVFKNLGLLIIDEEHRFGVRQKEQLKKMRSDIDVLTLTATPIPRTLSMSLEGLRDFSLITTAPQRRLAVKTFVKPFSESSVQEAMLREFNRNGQVFFLHNEVETIDNMKERLTQLIPNAKIAVAHGQLHEKELEHIMRSFLQHQYNVLLCTTIIETGIDIPNANTIIINRADKFGIAQLHQLRGRVGRSHHQAYAYLLIPEHINKDAERRLDAIAAADELGSGFNLAMQDLEIRGAGEILGEGQSGEIIQVGLTLYTEMLKQAVQDLKKGRTPDLNEPLKVVTEIKLHSPALLPECYCPDVHERLVLYKRLASSESSTQIDVIHEELVDRFGLPDDAVQNLLASHRLRILAKRVGIDSIDASEEMITLTLSQQHHLDISKIIKLIQSDRRYRLIGAEKLRFEQYSPNLKAKINHIQQLITSITLD